MSDNTPNTDPGTFPEQPHPAPDAPQMPPVTPPTYGQNDAAQQPTQPAPGAPYVAPVPEYGGPQAPGSGLPEGPEYGTPQAPGYGGQQGYGMPAAPGYAPVPTSVPGKTLGIVGLIVSCILPISFVGLVLSIIALVQSKKVRVKNTPAIVGIIIGAVGIVIGLVMVIGFIAFINASVGALDACLAGANSVSVWGIQIPCSELLAAAAL